jgi:hypothetical protein
MIILDYGTVNSEGGITALYYGADSEQIARFYFWSCRAYLACVGGVDAGDLCQFGSWMMFVSLCLSFCEAGKGWRMNHAGEGTIFCHMMR